MANLKKGWKGVLWAISKTNGQIILFIDEMHTMVGAGKTEGAMDAGNMLKPDLPAVSYTVLVQPP